jgi:hypothetical protein
MSPTSSSRLWGSNSLVTKRCVCGSEEGSLHWGQFALRSEVHRQVRGWRLRKKISKLDLNVYMNECEILLFVFPVTPSSNTPTSSKSTRSMTIPAFSTSSWSTAREENSIQPITYTDARIKAKSLKSSPPSRML